MNRSEISDATRFDLEEALGDMYQITTDLPLALDEEERRACLQAHCLRVDKLFNLFEDMIMRGKIL